MVTQIDGVDVAVRVGLLVQPDNWGWGSPLQACEWEGASFRLHSARHPDRGLAVNVTVTGRSIQKGRKVRVKIEFVGDGEPSTYHTGWMYLTN